MMKIKTAQMGSRPDFRDTGMRSLMGALEDKSRYTAQAYERLKQYQSDQQFYIGLAEIEADQELAYALNEALGNEWRKIITGSII